MIQRSRVQIPIGVGLFSFYPFSNGSFIRSLLDVLIFFVKNGYLAVQEYAKKLKMHGIGKKVISLLLTRAQSFVSIYSDIVFIWCDSWC